MDTNKLVATYFYPVGTLLFLLITGAIYTSWSNDEELHDRHFKTHFSEPSYLGSLDSDDNTTFHQITSTHGSVFYINPYMWCLGAIWTSFVLKFAEVVGMINGNYDQLVRFLRMLASIVAMVCGQVALMAVLGITDAYVYMFVSLVSISATVFTEYVMLTTRMVNFVGGAMLLFLYYFVLTAFWVHTENSLVTIVVNDHAYPEESSIDMIIYSLVILKWVHYLLVIVTRIPAKQIEEINDIVPYHEITAVFQVAYLSIITFGVGSLDGEINAAVDNKTEKADEWESFLTVVVIIAVVWFFIGTGLVITRFGFMGESIKDKYKIPKFKEYNRVAPTPVGVEMRPMLGPSV